MAADPAMSDQPLYRFKWKKVSLESYARDLRTRAQNLRRDAEVLVKRADQIDEVSYEIENAMEEYDPDTKDNA